MDAQFTEDGLFAVMFNTHAGAGDTEKAYQDACAMYEKAYGAPTEKDEGANSESWTWKDAESGTTLLIQRSNTGANAPIFQIGVFEHWRYDRAQTE